MIKINTSTDAKSSSSYHHGDLRQALVNAAWNSIQEQGPESLSLAALAKTIGVSQAAPFRHFADRSSLLAAVALHGFTTLFTLLTAAVNNPRGKGSAVSRFAHAYARFGTENPAIYRLMLASSVIGDSAEDTELRVTARRSLQLLIDTLTDIPNAQLRRRRAVHIWAALHGAVMLGNQHLLAASAVATSLTDLVDTIITN
ncbi:MAG: TetR/AcrR family transcriptional regulator [Pseudomonadales bacterium]|jgi:AcrR family transcriptional regulator|nr:TetR/AcrR family transcriptional regulator [Pseudomonadales bacterium]